MGSAKRSVGVLLLIIGVIAAGAGIAAARSQMRFAVTPGQVRPGGAVTLHVAAHQRRCRLSITDRGRLIYTVTVPRGHTRLPFSARSAPGRLVLHVRCGRHSISRHLSVVRGSHRHHHSHKRRGRHRPAHHPSGSPQPPVAPTPPTGPTGSGPVTVTAPPVTTPPAPVAATPSPGGGHTPPHAGGPPAGGLDDPSPAGAGGTPGPPAPPTPAETAAVHWAAGWLGRRAFFGQSLLFTYLAYAQGAGIDLRAGTRGIGYTPFTGPQDVWGPTTAGSTGTGTPPFGALVFFTARWLAPPAGWRSPRERAPAHSTSSVAIMGAQGEMVAVPDAVDATAVHSETLAQATGPGSPLTYAGWWLPDR